MEKSKIEIPASHVLPRVATTKDSSIHGGELTEEGRGRIEEKQRYRAEI